MSDAPPNTELLRSLGRLVRGLSALFWGLPVALITCAQSVKTDWLQGFGVAPPAVTTVLLVYGLLQMGHFQRQERVWRHALDRAQLLGLLTAGLSPFIYWWNKLPGHPYFQGAVALLSLTSLIFLGQINLVLRRLGAMLPDETLRQETRQFTALNRALLTGALLLTTAYWALPLIGATLPPFAGFLVAAVEKVGLGLLIVFVLLPLAMTMALIWKTKEVILESLFGSRG